MRGLRVLLALKLLIATAWPAAGGAASTTDTLAIVRRLTPASARYEYVPFDVPAGATRLRVAYRYERANGDTVIDLGLFEPGPLDLATAAFRGYSGGARAEVVIGGDEATPGYRPGPLPAGRWHALLGLYKVAPASVDVAVMVEVATGGAPPDSVWARGVGSVSYRINRHVGEPADGSGPRVDEVRVGQRGVLGRALGGRVDAHGVHGRVDAPAQAGRAEPGVVGDDQRVGPGLDSPEEHGVVGPAGARRPAGAAGSGRRAPARA
ncbi:MAG: hypothetical protein AB1635_21445 [Acidobacteriota bacterium]